MLRLNDSDMLEGIRFEKLRFDRWTEGAKNSRNKIKKRNQLAEAERKTRTKQRKG
jgi:hypothetical protein